MSLDGNGRYTFLDPRLAVKLMVAECCRNLACTGALPIGATNNLNFGNPERPEIMAQIVEAIEGMAEACEFFETPITGGNVSLYNETLGDPIFPSPVMGIVGIMKTQAPVGIAFRQPGRAIFLIGGIGAADDLRMGGTQFAKQVVKDIWGLPPALDMAFEKNVHALVRQLVTSGAVESAHDISGGGLAWCLAESAFPNSIGAAIDLDSDLRPELLLYHEGPSRVVVSTADPSALLQLAAAHGVPALNIGVTSDDQLVIRNRGAVLVETPVSALKASWAAALENLLHADVHA
jgi:phosphoribosylformylglycinamidine synthase